MRLLSMPCAASVFSLRGVIKTPRGFARLVFFEGRYSRLGIFYWTYFRRGFFTPPLPPPFPRPL
jgi:hypothetical protein